MNASRILFLFVIVLILGMYLRRKEAFVPNEAARVPTTPSAFTRWTNKSTQRYAPAKENTGLYEVVIPMDYYQGNQMPTDLDGPYWPSTLRPRNYPDYAWRLSTPSQTLIQVENEIYVQTSNLL